MTKTSPNNVAIIENTDYLVIDGDYSIITRPGRPTLTNILSYVQDETLKEYVLAQGAIDSNNTFNGLQVGQTAIVFDKDDLTYFRLLTRNV